MTNVPPEAPSGIRMTNVPLEAPSGILGTFATWGVTNVPRSP